MAEHSIETRDRSGWDKPLNDVKQATLDIYLATLNMDDMIKQANKVREQWRPNYCPMKQMLEAIAPFVHQNDQQDKVKTKHGTKWIRAIQAKMRDENKAKRNKGKMYRELKQLRKAVKKQENKKKQIESWHCYKCREKELQLLEKKPNAT